LINSNKPRKHYNNIITTTFARFR